MASNHNGLFVFECSCGERYSEMEDAVYCRKCEVYTEAGRCTYVTDLRKGQVVWGTNPFAKPYAPEVWTQPKLADIWG